VIRPQFLWAGHSREKKEQRFALRGKSKKIFLNWGSRGVGGKVHSGWVGGNDSGRKIRGKRVLLESWGSRGGSRCYSGS